MQLTPISGQNKTRLLEFYDPRRWPEHWERMPQMMCDLIRHLEGVEHSPAWVFTSHHELLFTNRDDWRTWRVAVVVNPKEPGTEEVFYRVTYAMSAPWWHATGYASDVQTAAALVLEGLDRAVPAKPRNVFFNHA